MKAKLNVKRTRTNLKELRNKKYANNQNLNKKLKKLWVILNLEWQVPSFNLNKRP